MSLYKRYLQRLGWDIDPHALKTLRGADEGGHPNKLMLLSTHFYSLFSGVGDNKTVLMGMMMGFVIWICVLQSYGLRVHTLHARSTLGWLNRILSLRLVGADRAKNSASISTVDQVSEQFCTGEINRLVLLGHLERQGTLEELGSGVYHILCKTGADLGFLAMDHVKKRVFLAGIIHQSDWEPYAADSVEFAHYLADACEYYMSHPRTGISITSDVYETGSRPRVRLRVAHSVNRANDFMETTRVFSRDLRILLVVLLIACIFVGVLLSYRSRRSERRNSSSEARM